MHWSVILKRPVVSASSAGSSAPSNSAVESGQRYPLVPQLDPEESANHLGNVARWIGLSVLPRWILEFLKLEVTPDIRQTPGVSSEHNRNLYLLQRAVFERGPRLAGLLARGIPKAGGGQDELATRICSVAATWPQPDANR